MARARTAIFGRDAELAELDDALRGRPRLVVLRGPAGIGRSALLDTLERTWGHADVQVVTVRFADGAADPFGALATVAAVREHYERVGVSRLADSIATVSRLGAPGAASGAGPAATLLVELVAMFALVRGHRRTVLLVDDVQAVPRPALVLAAARRAGCLVVAGYRQDESTDSADHVFAAADRIIDLAGLPEAATAQLLGQAACGPVDEALAPALRAALGPLYGNPGTLLSMMDDLRTGGRLVAVHEQLCLRDRHEPVALPADHRLVRRYRALDPAARAVLALLAGQPGLGVDDLPAFAEALDANLDGYGRAVDELVESGLLTADARGVLHWYCPALAAAVTAEIGVPGLARLAATVADRLVRKDPAAGHDPLLLADQLALAGTALSPTPAAATALIGPADRLARTESGRAVRWYRAALWHLEPPRVDRPRLIAAVFRLLLNTGDHRQLAAVIGQVTDYVDGRYPRPGEWAEIATGAALAALHTGAPLGLAGFDAVGQGDHPAIGFAHRWFTGAVFTGSGQPAGPVIPRQADTSGALLTAAQLDRATELLAGDALGDLVAVFQQVLGPGYGTPIEGPPAAYHRVRLGFADGDWTGALSAVRELELSGLPNTPVHHLGRLLAAEMCAYRGEARRAAGWLAQVPEGGPFEALRGWVRAGSLLVGADPAAALATGWQHYQRSTQGGAPLGRERLLLRLTAIAARTDQPDWAQLLLAEAAQEHERTGSPANAETHLLARGLVLADGEAARAGAELARQRGHQPDLAFACLVVGRLADQPQDWLHEAYQIAGRLGSSWLRAYVKNRMRDHGVAVPRNRSVREPFSGTELRIIELIRDGRTNRQIAADVRISEKTVENHLTRLFARTGCRSRVELAAASLAGRLLVAGEPR
ncbi:MAG TPA: LuxR family transcriptional regulator [Pseudonocardiaceae bacterium]|jgi:DNA-binding CsgD family transcriptional regulator|nr:LuxR family transcriptional regulator [Pseudonocardiaceae bacterium]